MKKKIMCCMAFIFTLTLSSVFVFAQTELDPEVMLQQEIEAAQQYAYMDLDTAPEDMREKILEARNVIINSQSWVADGGQLIIKRADGTVEEAPQFSELFPGWDLPSSDVTVDSIGFESNFESNTEGLNWSGNIISSLYDESKGFEAAFNSLSTNPLDALFFAFNLLGRSVETRAWGLSDSETLQYWVYKYGN